MNQTYTPRQLARWIEQTGETIILEVKTMTYDEALQALERAQSLAWAGTDDLCIHDRIIQAIDVFKRMNENLNQCEADLKEWEEIGNPDGKEDKTDGRLDQS